MRSLHQMKFILKLSFLLLCNNVFAQIETDRPDFTESPNVVPNGAFQIETGFVFEKDFLIEQGHVYSASFEFNNFTYNTTLLRYGLLENLELRANFQFDCYHFQELKVLESKIIPTTLEYTGDTIKKGITTSFIGFKTNLYKNNNFSLGFLGHLYIPDLATGDFTRTVGQKIGPEFLVPAALSLNDKLGLNGQVGITWDGMSSVPRYNYNFGVNYAIGTRLSTYLESVNYFYLDEKILFLNGGVTYLVNDNFQLDLTGGLGLNDAAPDYFINGGLSYRILRK